VAVYSKKDYENFINRDKIRKRKIKKRIFACLYGLIAIGIIVGTVFLFMQDRTNYIKEDNYTDAINYAIDKFATIKPMSHDDYPRLTYDFYSLPPITPNDSVEDNNIHKDYALDNNKDTTNNNTNIENNASVDNTIKNTDNKTEIKPNNEDANKGENKGENNNPDYIVDEDEEKPAFFEYDYFVEIAGKGNYPGYNVVGPNFIQNIRTELCLAIKAYTTMPIASGSLKGNYRLDYHDDTYDYVYFFLLGEVKKVDKNYLKTLDETALNKNYYNLDNFWISLTEDKSSQLSKLLLNQSNEGIYTVIVSDKTGNSLDEAKVSFISGSYIETITAPQNSLVVFTNVPHGTAELKIEKSGYIDFPHEVAYKEYEQINIANDKTYYGQNFSGPLRVKLLASSVAKCSFSYTTLQYEYGTNGYTPVQETIDGNFNVVLKNKKTKEETKTTIRYDGTSLYWFEFFNDTAVGQYDIDIYPTNTKYKPLFLKNVYINEHGIGNDGYLDKNSDYIFAFNTDEYVNVEFRITDGTSFGLAEPKGKLGMYQLVKTNVMKKDGWVELKLVDCDNKKETTATLFVGSDNILVGSVDVKQDRKYDIYVSTVFGDVLLYDNLNLRTNNYLFSANITDNILPQCIAELYVRRNEECLINIMSIDGNQKYSFEKQVGDSGRYLCKTDVPINSGYYYLNIMDNSNNLLETYVVLVSNKSNNFTVEFK